jgi:hypothetical protein
VKIYLEDIYDIFFYHKWFVYISIAHTIHIFLLHCSNFIKMCVTRCAQIMTYFFLLVDINLNHNVILYFFKMHSLEYILLKIVRFVKY